MSLRVTEQRAGLPVLAFRNGEGFEHWLDEQPSDAPGAWLKLPKKSAGAPGLTKAEAIDSALCYGWIDGQLDKYDDTILARSFHTPEATQQMVSSEHETSDPASC